jgi:hypothetical protein
MVLTVIMRLPFPRLSPPGDNRGFYLHTNGAVIFGGCLIAAQCPLGGAMLKVALVALQFTTSNHRWTSLFMFGFFIALD